MRSIFAFSTCLFCFGCVSQSSFKDYVAEDMLKSISAQNEVQQELSALKLSRNETIELLQSLSQKGELNTDTGKKAVERLDNLELAIQKTQNKIDRLKTDVARNEQKITSNEKSIESNSNEIKKLKDDELKKRLDVLLLLEKNKADQKKLQAELFEEDLANSKTTIKAINE